MKIYMEPNPTTAPDSNGIGRVVRAMYTHLPKFGFEVVASPDGADIHAYHAGSAAGKRVDVLHCHGLYWIDLPHAPFKSFHETANRNVIAAARRAKVITVPSPWVAEPFKRDMRISPAVIGHGIDFGEWEPGKNEGYILWNKNRVGDVCDPTAAGYLAEKGYAVVSTFSPSGQIVPNLTLIGKLPYEKMKGYIQNAGIYLATTPETFGVGTLEAMACGVPILGYDWCGTSDLIVHQETGWLTEPGNLEGLVEGCEWLKQHREEVGANAREAASKFDWPSVVGEYAKVYEKAARPDPVGISVVISNYNYGQWVGDAIESVLAQTEPVNEIIVVDDGSTDNSMSVLKPYEKEGKIKIISQVNSGVAAARNAGVEAASFPIILNLDADDELSPYYVANVYPKIAEDRGVGIAYSGVKFLTAKGKDSGAETTFKEFRWEVQSREGVPPPTCIPSASMFRKEMWRRCGGFRQQYAPGEDTEFWTNGLSVGFTAVLATPEALFWYRGHEGSASRTGSYVAIDDNKPWIHDKQFPLGAPAERTPPVYSYAMPAVSIIIPVGPGHEIYVEGAIESVLGQTVRMWECIVIDDTGLPNKDFAGPLKRTYPFLKVVKTAGKVGAGAARNVGIRRAKGGFVLFLDADDWIRKDTLEAMLDEFVRTGRYVYSDFYAVGKDGADRKNVFEYDRAFYLEKQVIHSVTALVPTEWARDVGGFDPDLVGWEEYDFYMKMAIKGYCGIRLGKPLLFYRLNSGSRRKKSQSMSDELNAHFRTKYGGVTMAGCCGGNNNSLLDAKRALRLLPSTPAELGLEAIPVEQGIVRLEFVGQQVGPIGFQVNGRTYYGAKDNVNRFINVPREDVAKLTLSGKWKIVQMPEPQPQREPEARRIVVEDRVASDHIEMKDLASIAQGKQTLRKGK